MALKYLSAAGLLFVLLAFFLSQCPATPATPGIHPGIHRQAFDRIKKYMTRNEVEATIGKWSSPSTAPGPAKQWGARKWGQEREMGLVLQWTAEEAIIWVGFDEEQKVVFAAFQPCGKATFFEALWGRLGAWGGDAAEWFCR
jgi:hypothetical protein